MRSLWTMGVGAAAALGLVAYIANTNAQNRDLRERNATLRTSAEARNKLVAEMIRSQGVAEQARKAAEKSGREAQGKIEALVALKLEGCADAEIDGSIADILNGMLPDTGGANPAGPGANTGEPSLPLPPLGEGP